MEKKAEFRSYNLLYNAVFPSSYCTYWKRNREIDLRIKRIIISEMDFSVS